MSETAYTLPRPDAAAWLAEKALHQAAASNLSSLIRYFENSEPQDHFTTI
jgi:hypothetical protein